MSNVLTLSNVSMKPLTLHELVIAHQSEELYSSFVVSDGAMIDLDGLAAIAEAPERVVLSALSSLSTTDNNQILHGMELSGTALSWPAEMPDGETMRRVPIHARGLMRLESTVQVSEGLAIVRDRRGCRHAVRLTSPMSPDGAPPTQDAALVLSVEVAQDDLAARGTVRPRLHYVSLAEAREPHHLILAMTVRKGIWASDVNRLVSPDHAIITGILELLANLEHVTWTEDRHGWPWDRRQQGREWSRYQTTATLALQATRTALMTHASSTMDRIRLLRNLHFQLRRSIERAEQNLLKWMGATEAPDPYRLVIPIDGALAVAANRRISSVAQEFQKIFGTYQVRDQSKDSKRAYAQVFVYAPLNRTGYDTLVAQFSSLTRFLEHKHAANPDLLAPQDVELVIRGGEARRFDDPRSIVDELVRVSGWDPR
jgi:hypothetical protein